LTLAGVVAFTKAWSDPDGDLPTYTITTPPTKGTVLLNTDVLGLIGVTAYTANNLLFPQADTFVVTVSDGHGFSQSFTLKPF
jgi:hypothetical protein